MLRYQQDLIRIGSYTLRPIDQPYVLEDPWETSVQNVYQKLKYEMQQRNRIRIMIYGYYLGKLIQLSITPREKWQEFTRSHQISNGYYFFKGSTRIYELFKRDPNQIYQTLALSFRIIARMKTPDLQQLLQCNQELDEIFESVEL